MNEYFQYVISLPCPHDRNAVMDWLRDNQIRFSYSTFNAPLTVEFNFTSEAAAVMFALRWL